MRKILLLALLLTSTAWADPNQDFQTLADAYFDQYYFPTNPTIAVELGLHQYDASIEDYSKTAINKELTQLQTFEKRLATVDPKNLDQYTRGDYELVMNKIHARLLSLQNIREWEKDPSYYANGITTAAFALMHRNFAPEDSRLRSLIAREKLMPTALAEGKKILKNPPKIYTDIAIQQLPGIIEFFKKDVPSAFTHVKDAALQKEFMESNNNVIQALEDYQAWLTKNLLPRSHGSYQIGTANFSKMLKYEEMVETPLNKLLEIGWENLKKNQAEYDLVLQKLLVDGETKEQLEAEIKTNHPPSDKLLPAFSNTFSDLIGFIRKHKIITIPSDVKPTMQETPPFMRATTLASMDTPGPFETKSKEAYFNVTLPEATWDAAKVADFLGFFNREMVINTSIHETYPGHYVQFLWAPKIKGRVRKILGSRSNAEGWAHYTEQMMLEQGYGQTSGERTVLLLKLAQLKAALLRNARFIVGIEMHTGHMTMEQARAFFVKEGKQTNATADIEVKRGTSDPIYLVYTLGKLEIIKLRQEVEAKLGKDFNLQKFHDDFMMQGYPPIKIVREAMLST